MGGWNSGRRPQPTALNVLRGNPGKRSANPNEPIPTGVVVKPGALSRLASAVWDELAPVCLSMGTLTAADVRAFGTLCELQATLQQASAAKDAGAPARLTTGQAGAADGPLVVVIDAVLRLERDTATAIRPYYDAFGLTPSARARLTVPKPAAAPVSKWAGVLLP